jgi:osmoprotectant transport system permease protein
MLDDDLGYFEDYQAILLYRAELAEEAPAAVAAFRRLEGAIDESTMAGMNGAVKLEGDSEQTVAARLLSEGLGLEVTLSGQGFWSQLGQRTLEHLGLVGVSLGAAILFAVPLGVLAAQNARLGHLILGITGVIQTIPSLALFVFLIPWLGIGWLPTVVALFLYSLLPIVRNTHAGLMDIPVPIRESADVLGLTCWARLRLIELPLAANTILAGIKTSAVLNVGTATVAALIGAGGYGQPILTGIRLDDTALIMQGAVPAALLALGLQGLFEFAERWVVPRGLRLKPTDGVRAEADPDHERPGP